MKDFNHVVLSGRIANLEKLGEGEKTFLTFSLANHVPSKKDGKWEDKTQWINCKVFKNNWAEALSKHLEKGIEVSVQGKIVVETYKNKIGEERTAWYINVSELISHGKTTSQGISCDEVVADEDMPL
jgi:single stranded DNA-binding protein